ncbi:MAG: nucleotidyltransferase domain-containing protein [Candidatus Thorarchaeota archaeon]|nr:nucleotidyltransferase domain-containing protein [Candidatus Thorarchaeota archaeon]
MTDIQKRFKMVLDDTVKEWKNHENVKGIFVYGSFAKGTATANSDLDIGIIWDAGEAPVRLMSTHKEVLIDMAFMTVGEIEDVLNYKTEDVLKISEAVNRLRSSRILFDTDDLLKRWQKKAMEYSWSDTVINKMKELALNTLTLAKTYASRDDFASAIYEMREGLYQFGRVIVMANDIFTVLKPAEVLTEVRMLNPIAYQLFLRTYKLKGMDEPRLLKVLEDLREWLERLEKHLAETEDHGQLSQVTRLLAQAQRQYYGSLGLTYGSDYELAVLEMREATSTLGKAIVALKGDTISDDTDFIGRLRDTEETFFHDILVEHGAYDIQPSEISRIINEVEFLIRRV